MTEKDYISRCKHEIEKQFNLPEDLIERDFEYLHEVLLEQTQTDISTSTLRRIWSDKYQSIPQTKTLDALARLLGHAGWHAFKQEATANKPPRLNLKVAAYILGVVAMVSAVLLFMASDEAVGEALLTPEVLTYEGVPATIGFHYTIKNPNVDIELSWNPYERTRLEMNQDFYTGTYFYPDYHHAKLLYDEQVLASAPVHVTTKGWHGLIMDAGYDANPTYLERADYLSAEGLYVKQEDLLTVAEKSGIALPVFTLSHSDLSALSGDDFTLKTIVKSQAYAPSQTCLVYEVLIKGANGNIRVPISKTGCYGLTDLKCSGKLISGKKNDLSALSTELEQEHSVIIRLKDKEMIITVENNAPYSVQYDNEIGSLKVIKFIFQGVSEIIEFELLGRNGNRLDSPALYPF